MLEAFTIKKKQVALFLKKSSYTAKGCEFSQFNGEIYGMSDEQPTGTTALLSQ